MVTIEVGHGDGSTDHFSALKIWMFENKFVSLLSHLKTIALMSTFFALKFFVVIILIFKCLYFVINCVVFFFSTLQGQCKPNAIEFTRNC